MLSFCSVIASSTASPMHKANSSATPPMPIPSTIAYATRPATAHKLAANAAEPSSVFGDPGHLQRPKRVPTSDAAVSATPSVRTPASLATSLDPPSHTGAAHPRSR
ncbi:hypothetical protein LPJ75_001694 [Coemansia sp. RSA 2598]|nr:hypothetical protein LPJ75_001694 [Coemansia sp. RSA 2598]